MKQITKFYIGTICIAAVIVVAGMYVADPAYGRADVQVLAFLSALAILSEMLAYTLAREGRGSVAFIPYLASVIIVPSWIAVVVVTLVKGLMELVSHVDRRKALFNACSH